MVSGQSSVCPLRQPHRTPALLQAVEEFPEDEWVDHACTYGTGIPLLLVHLQSAGGSRPLAGLQSLFVLPQARQISAMQDELRASRVKEALLLDCTLPS